jgi:prophage regulatory protein
MMLREDILDRLRVDPGQRTLGQILQDREAAAYEIRRLRSDIEHLRATRTLGRAGTERPPDSSIDGALNPGMLLRLRQLCELLSISRSTVYKWVSEGTFPSPVRISERAVRWRTEDIVSWRSALD